MDTKMQAAITATKCVISIDDNDAVVFVTVPAGFKPPQAVVRQWHETAGKLGYGLKIKAAQ